MINNLGMKYWSWLTAFSVSALIWGELLWLALQ
ncbi:small membrane protein YmiC [Kosakonia cowanii]|nr:small membrane protein YmiC [Kosakonia cowanii]WRY59601.1 small membrane protein YmiC [Kosakonia cowanii]